jgi:hypothetical protein
MATSSPARGPAARTASETSKAEQFVATQIQRARQRVRLAELGKAALECALLVVGYSVVLAFLDRWLQISSFYRQLAFSVCCLVLGAFLAWKVVWPAFQRINPYYAARLVEQNLDRDKNSLINWLDLHDQPMVPAFRTAISNQAARDLGSVDLEQTIAAKPSKYSLIGGGVLLALLLLLFAASPRQFISLMKRAWAPFTEATIATRTRITMIEPPDGDLTVAIGKAVTIEALVDGRIPDQNKPDAVRVLFRNVPGDPFETRLLDRSEDPQRWRTTFLAPEVRTGFYYKVAAGDAETPEYQVHVRSNPLLTNVDVKYHYRPYLHWPDRVTQDPNLKDLRGTEVALTVHTNRQVRDGRLIIEGQKPVAGEVRREDPESLHFELVLEKDTQYRVSFTSVEGETNRDTIPFTIQVLSDQTPVVVLTVPGKDVEKGVNEILTLKGQASDDLGLAALTLRLKTEDGKLLESIPYRAGKTLARGDGRPPQMLEYQEVVDLAKLRLVGGKAYEPQVGQTIEYWLEAADFCDFPVPNVGSSKHFKVAFRESVAPQKQQKDRHKADQDKQAHDQKQDEQLKNQRDEAQGAQSDQQKEGEKNDQANKEGAKSDQQQEGANGQQGDKKSTGESKSGEGRQKSGQQKDKGTGDGQSQKSDGAQAGDPPKNQGSENRGQQGTKSGEQPKEQGTKQDGQAEKNAGRGGEQQRGQEPKTGEQPKGQSGKQDESQKGNGSETGSQKNEGGQQGEKQKDPGAQQNRPGEKSAHQDGKKPEAGGEKNSNNQENESQKGQNDSGTKQGNSDQQKNTNPNTGNREQGSRGGAEHRQGDKSDQAGASQKGTKNEPGDQQKDSGQPSKEAQKLQDQLKKLENALKESQKGNQSQPGEREKPGSTENKQSQEKPGTTENKSSQQKDRAQGEKRSEKQDSASGQKQPEKDNSGKTGESTGAKENPGKNPTEGAKQNEGQRGGSQQSPEKQGEAAQKKPGDPGKNAPEKTGSNEKQKSKSGEQGAGDPQKKDAVSDQKGEGGKTQPGTEAERKAADPKQDATGAERRQGDQGTRPQGEGRPSQANDKGNSKSTDSRDREGSKPGADEKKTPTEKQGQTGRPDKTNEGKPNESGNKGEAGGEKTGQESQRDQTVKPDERKAREALEQLRKDLQSSDPGTREAAQKKVEEIRKLAQDPAVRKAAEDMKSAMDKEKQGAGQGNEREKGNDSKNNSQPKEKQGAGKGNESDKGSEPKAGGERPGESQRNGQVRSQQKPGEQGKPGDTPSGNREGQKQTSPQGQDAKGTKQANSATDPSKGPGKVGEARPPEPGQGKAAEGEGNRPDSPPGAGEPVDDKNYRKQAGELILDKVKKNVTDDVLKKANLTPEEYKKFVDAYERMLKEDRRRAANKENLPAPFQGGAPQPNRGIRKVDALNDPKFKAEQSGPASAPSEFRDAYSKFTKGLAEIGTNPPKK